MGRRGMSMAEGAREVIIERLGEAAKDVRVIEIERGPDRHVLKVTAKRGEIVEPIVTKEVPHNVQFDRLADLVRAIL